jgi:hypothetical protein
MKYTHNPLGWEDWMRAKMGEKAYFDLRGNALNGPKADLKETLALLQLEAARLGIT